MSLSAPEIDWTDEKVSTIPVGAPAQGSDLMDALPEEDRTDASFVSPGSPKETATDVSGLRGADSEFPVGDRTEIRQCIEEVLDEEDEQGNDDDNEDTQPGRRFALPVDEE
jgi:hypothetical protein